MEAARAGQSLQEQRRAALHRLVLVASPSTPAGSMKLDASDAKERKHKRGAYRGAFFLDDLALFLRRFGRPHLAVEGKRRRVPKR